MAFSPNKVKKFLSDPVVIVLTLVVVLLVLCNSKSLYRLSPSTLTVNAPPAPKDGIFGLPYSLKCVPGPQATAGYYTKDLTPGGICGAQEFVEAQAGNYQIPGGIGGSLLDEQQTKILDSDLVHGYQ
jgi:hypothetical protein